MNGILKDYLSFRNGKTSPERVETGQFTVFGSNGPIGQTTMKNANGPFIVIGRVGSYCGSLYYSEGDAWVTDNAIVCTSNSPAETRYWYYLLQTLDLNSRSSGSGQPLLNQTVLGAIEASIAASVEREAIAEILGALDDKIAANTKLAATADELATSLFHEALTNAEWSDKTFADIAQVTGGGTPSTKTPEYWDGDIAWATPTDITGLTGPYLESTSRTISADGLSACASPLYPKGSILMTSRATIGAFAITQIPTAVNQGFIVVQPSDPALDYWIFHEMRSRVDEFISMANGATFLELSRGNFKKFKVRLASDSVMSGFSERARPLHDSARMSLLENTKLAATRDTLLPQLMSGKLRVKDAESAVGSFV